MTENKNKQFTLSAELEETTKKKKKKQEKHLKKMISLTAPNEGNIKIQKINITLLGLKLEK